VENKADFDFLINIIIPKISNKYNQLRHWWIMQEYSWNPSRYHIHIRPLIFSFELKRIVIRYPVSKKDL